VLDTTIRKQTQTKQIHNMCWTPLYVNKHKQLELRQTVFMRQL